MTCPAAMPAELALDAPPELPADVGPATSPPVAEAVLPVAATKVVLRGTLLPVPLAEAVAKTVCATVWVLLAEVTVTMPVEVAPVLAAALDGAAVEPPWSENSPE